jgi:hypothetical protein
MEDDWIDVAEDAPRSPKVDKATQTEGDNNPNILVDKSTQTEGDNCPTKMNIIVDKETQTEDELFIATSNPTATKHDTKPTKTRRAAQPPLRVFTLAQNPYNVSRTGQFKKFM